MIETKTNPPRSLHRFVRLCGHCGSEPAVYSLKTGVHYVTCVEGHCRKPMTSLHMTRQGAIDEWNEETV